jgi:hypothetical protein
MNPRWPQALAKIEAERSKGYANESASEEPCASPARTAVSSEGG